LPELWCRIIKKHRIASHLTEPLDEAASSASLPAITDTLEEVCRKLDVPRPILLSKHERDYAMSGKTYFTQDHFIERVSFDRLEIEYIDPDRKPDKPRDPRSEA
jgi:hypothetical protein